MYASSHRPTDAGRRLRQCGQSVVELAVAVPVLVLLLMSVFNMTVLISDRLIAGYATRTGARMAAELGDGQGGLTTAQVDQQIEESVFASSTNLDFATISRIDIYHPTRSDGAWLSTDPQDSYDVNRNAIGTPTYPVTIRKVTPPNEDSIGVRIVWQYTPATGIYSFTVALSEYTVMKEAPVLQ
jgi:Flp pilus assembly protein TadG